MEGALSLSEDTPDPWENILATPNEQAWRDNFDFAVASGRGDDDQDDSWDCEKEDEFDEGEFKSGDKVEEMLREDELFFGGENEKVLDEREDDADYNRNIWKKKPWLGSPGTYFGKHSAPFTKDEMIDEYPGFKSPKGKKRNQYIQSVLDFGDDVENEQDQGNREIIVDELKFTPNRTQLVGKSLKKLQEKYGVAKMDAVNSPDKGESSTRATDAVKGFPSLAIPSAFAEPIYLQCGVGKTCAQDIPIRNKGDTTLKISPTVYANVKKEGKRSVYERELQVRCSVTRIVPGEECIMRIVYKPIAPRESISYTIDLLNCSGLDHSFTVFASAEQAHYLIPDRPVVNFGGVEIRQKQTVEVVLKNVAPFDLDVQLEIVPAPPSNDGFGPNDNITMEEDMSLLSREAIANSFRLHVAARDSKGVSSTPSTFKGCRNESTRIPAREEIVIIVMFRPSVCLRYRAALSMKARLKDKHQLDGTASLVCNTMKMPLLGYGGRPLVIPKTTTSLGMNKASKCSVTGWYQADLVLQNTGKRTAFINAKPPGGFESRIKINPPTVCLPPGKSQKFLIRCREGVLLDATKHYSSTIRFEWVDEVVRKLRNAARRRRGIIKPHLDGNNGYHPSPGEIMAMTHLDSFDDATSLSFAMDPKQSPIHAGNLFEFDSYFDEEIFEKQTSVITVGLFWSDERSPPGSNSHLKAAIEAAHATQSRDNAELFSVRPHELTIRAGENSHTAFIVRNNTKHTIPYICSVSDNRFRVSPPNGYILRGEDQRVLVRCIQAAYSGENLLTKIMISSESTCGNFNQTIVVRGPPATKEDKITTDVKSSKPERGVEFKEQLVRFEPTKVGHHSLLKVRLTNYLRQHVDLSFSVVGGESASAVFCIRKQHSKLTLQKRNFIYLPIRFMPQSATQYHGAIVANTRDGKTLARIEVVGQGIN